MDGKALDAATAEGYELEIGSKSFIEGFEPALIGMKKNETKTIHLRFPENYHATELRGKPVDFEVTVKDIKTVKYPELTDEYVKTMRQDGLAKKAQTVDELRDSVRAQMQKSAAANTKNANHAAIKAFLVENTSFSHVPQKLVDDQARRIKSQYVSQIKQYKMELKDLLAMQNITEAKFDEQIRREAENNVKYSLASEKIAEREKIECAPEDYQKEVDRMLEESQITDPAAKADAVKRLEPQRDLIETMIVGDKLMEHLVRLNEK